MAGALPPAGQYYINYFQYYNATNLRDNSGHKVNMDVSIQANANAGRFIWVTKKKFLGADVGWHVIVPVVNEHVSLDTPGSTRQSKTGLGDIEFSPFILGWHWKNFHIVGTVDFMLPTGAYDKNDTANIGRKLLHDQPPSSLLRTWRTAGSRYRRRTCGSSTLPTRRRGTARVRSISWTT